jgi:N-acetylneuraminate 9-O-acetyltransferase
MIHKYSVQDTRRCYRLNDFLGKQNKFLFIGDVRIKQLFEGFVGHFQQSSSPSLEQTTNTLEYIDAMLKLHVNYIPASDLHTMLNIFERLQTEPDPPNFIVVSAKFILLSQPNKNENFTKELEKSFVKNLTLLISPTDKITRSHSRILWKLQDPIDDNNIEMQSPEWKEITNSDIERFNRIVSDTMKYSSVNIWRSGNQIAYGLIDEMKDGFKLGSIALKHDVQILLNIHCNDIMNYNDGTCCSTSENYTMLQIITYSLFLVFLAVMIGFFAKKYIAKYRGKTLYIPLQQDVNQPPIVNNRTQDLIIALGILGIIMVYFYLCDRTSFFMKENKYYSEFSFWIPVCWLSAVGLFFTDDSKFTRIMHRDQTDELKGFMIIVILIYYMTGATRVIPIYMLIKVFISTFLFLTGYQHTMYFWQTSDNGIVRFLNVMFKLNFMTIVLCFAMNRPYQFYFFAPLVSFWFAITYFMFTLPPRITSQSIENNSYQYAYLVIKFICLMSIITILYMSEVFFETIFLMRPWRALFVSTDDFVDEW